MIFLSGDVHHGYLAEAKFRDGNVESPIYQAVSSPLRNSLPGKKSRLQSAGWTKLGEFAGRSLTRLAGVGEEELSWRLTHEKLWFENQIATLKFEGRQAKVTFEKAVLDTSGEPNLRKLYQQDLV
jgi:hypothetical protein